MSLLKYINLILNFNFLYILKIAMCKNKEWTKPYLIYFLTCKFIRYIWTDFPLIV